MGILVYLAMIWGVWALYRRYLAPRRQKDRIRLRSLRSLLRERRRWDLELLSAEQLEECDRLLAEVDQACRERATSGDTDRLQYRAAALLEHAPCGRKRHWAAEIVELVVPVLGVVMGIRALFLQPFKIPTSSMQPTLYGIHYEHETYPEGPPGALASFFAYNTFAARAFKTEVPADVAFTGHEWDELTHEVAALPLGPLKLFKCTEFTMDDHTFRFPGSPEDVLRRILAHAPSVDRRLHPLYEDRIIYSFTAGRPIQGRLLLGDHLFVDRVSYNFVDPARGDIVVFITDDITRRGKPLSGRYYIKRLVGLPGDTLKIVDRKLYVRPPDATEFRLVDSDDDPAFGRIYSNRGGYHGYTHPANALRLRDNADAVTVPADSYFVLGDNSANSLDGRYWDRGFVPRRNIVGRACWVWWPFSRRWGPVDRVEPLDEPSPNAPPADRPSVKPQPPLPEPPPE